MTSKEVLEKLLNSPIVKMRNGSYLDIELIKSIKQDLERLEKLEEDVDDLLDVKLALALQNKQQDKFIGKLIEENKKLKEDRNDILKEFAELEKVIEILKNKTIVIVALKLSKNLDDYKRMTNFENLTQEEYKLLKEHFYDK